MAAPAYIWEFVGDLMGDRVPKVVTLEATANLETKVGTLVIQSSGQVDEAGNSATALLGIAMQAIGPATAADPIKVALLAPGMIIRGTADADASSLSGFNGNTVDLNADGSLDVADTANGSLSVYRTEDSGLTVYAVVSKGALFV